jgi:hypothetical protein
MGRIFDRWAVVVFGPFFLNCRCSANHWATFCHDTNCVNYDKKQGWVTLQAIFSKTHLVTLAARKKSAQA